MSNNTKAVQDEDFDQHPTSNINLLIRPGRTDLGGLTVRRSLPHPQRRMVGPWIFFDHMGPARFEPGQGIDVRPHPHINLATVTYLFEGGLMHRDSLGNAVEIVPGDINLMVAGSGIVHSERSPDALREAGHTLDGLQLWLALPESKQEMDPDFYHHESKSLPSIKVAGVKVRVLMGSAFGVTSPVKTYGRTLYCEATLKDGQYMILPNAPERAVYVVEGEIELDGVIVRAHSMAVLEEHAAIKLVARENSHIVLIGGQSFGERHIYWNFVSTSRERIEQAKKDWEEGNFAKIPGENEEYIPLPDPT